MKLERPDPDRLLEQLHADAAQARRGRFKIFFGASAGVGKTYAMLAAARLLMDQGVRVVVGVVETHARNDTERMAQDLERLPLREMEYRGRRLREFDLQRALSLGAQKAGLLVLVDELAHSNAPDSLHPKRWQDVEDLLNAGIDVWTTMNVQHLESLNDIVSDITGIRVRETVPDRIFDQADEVLVVDLSPDDLIARLRQGKVYGARQAETASRNFFRKGNLLALRELALRRTADRVDGEMQAYRLRSSMAPVWPNRQSLLACIGPGEHGEKVVRSCARLAAQLDVSWHAVFVDVPGARALSERRREQVSKVLKMAYDLGASTATIPASGVASALVRYAREYNLARVVMGRTSRRRPWRRTLSAAIEAEAEDLDILHVALSPLAQEPRAEQEDREGHTPIAWADYAAALGLCILTTLLATPLRNIISLTNIVMLFLLAVVGVALRYGRGPAILAAFVGVGLFDFFFVPPRFSFAVSDVQYLMTFLVMLVVALVIGQLTAGLKAQAQAASERERRVRGLYEMSRDLTAALMIEQVGEIADRFLRSEFNAHSALLVADDHDVLQIMPGAKAQVDRGVAQWAFQHGEAAGRGTDTLPASACLVLPLKATMRLRGVMAIELSAAQPLSLERRRILDTCASLLAISIERIHYIDVAQKTMVQVESERLRNSLLSTISHDLRTPIASVVGMAETLKMTKPAPSPIQEDLLDGIRQAALRMKSLVNNLLDMARLESGSVRLNRQWQPFEEVLSSALAACAPGLEGREVQVLAPDLLLLHWDAVLMERVFVNLLENAGKYTPAQTTITISAEHQAGEVVIYIDDQGPGLPAGREEAIFEKFERGSKESATAGVGLGLTICRAIMQAHAGSIRGETRADGGARFVLTLAQGEPPASVPEAETTA